MAFGCCKGAAMGWMPVPSASPGWESLAAGCWLGVGSAFPHSAQFISPPALASLPGQECKTLPEPWKGLHHSLGLCMIPRRRVLLEGRQQN